jgi:FixJ family two-component response regulator
MILGMPLSFTSGTPPVAPAAAPRCPSRTIVGATICCLKTVKGDRARVMEKMRAGSVVELVRLADEAGVTVPTT